MTGILIDSIQRQKLKNNFKNFLYVVFKHINLPSPTEIQYAIADELQYRESETSEFQILCIINTDKVYAERSSDGIITFTFMQPSSIETSSLYTDDLLINQLSKISFKLGDTNSDVTALVYRQKGV